LDERLRFVAWLHEGQKSETRIMQVKKDHPRARPAEGLPAARGAIHANAHRSPTGGRAGGPHGGRHARPPRARHAATLGAPWVRCEGTPRVPRVVPRRVRGVPAKN
jgi:hypothetical protein